MPVIHKLVIPGRLPGLNDYINAERGNRYKAAKLKGQIDYMVCMEAKRQLKGVRIEKPVIMHYLWVEKDRRRDKSNVAFGKKFIEDSLIKAGIILDDGWCQVEGFTDDFKVDKVYPRIEIEIVEV